MTVHIPRDWNPEQALAAINLLDDLIAAITYHYGDVLFGPDDFEAPTTDPQMRAEQTTSPPDPGGTPGLFTDDEIPF